MRILNLYAGIGGNRRLWGDEHEIVAVEYDPKIAAVYQDLWPKDEVVVADAHQYLLDHYHEFDFIWTSPPCQTHTTMNIANGLSPYEEDKERMAKQIANGGGYQASLPQNGALSRDYLAYPPLQRKMVCRECGGVLWASY